MMVVDSCPYTVLSINEIKMGVMHLVNLLSINEKLLSNLPTSSTLPIRADDDIARALSWCEERVLAINESMVLDNSKTTVTDDSKPIHERQMELASLIEVIIITVYIDVCVCEWL